MNGDGPDRLADDSNEMGFSLKRWMLATLTRRDLGLGQYDWKHLRFSYSQFGEDLIVGWLMEGRQGFYVDAGAFHPVRLSNTYKLYRRGWRGIVIDANPEFTATFRRRRPRDIVVNCAVSDTPGAAPFEVRTAGEFSGLQGFREEAGGPPVKRVVQVPVRTLASVLDEFLPPGQTVEYLNVDCEGADLAVLRSNDWQRCRPALIAVEDFAPRAGSEICHWLAQQGYEFFAEAGVTRLFKRPDFQRRV